MRSLFVTIPLSLLLFISSFPGSLVLADDPATGHYESALRFLQEGKTQQAMDDLRFIVKTFPRSPLADDALLQLGTYKLNQEKSLDEALAYFQKIKDSYTQSNSAPAAYYYIGFIHLQKRTAGSLDEAYANFERVSRVFPSSPWVGESQVGAGLALKWRGEVDRAYEEFSKVRIHSAESTAAPQAMFEAALCLVRNGAFLDAMYEFQQLIHHFRGTDYAEKALDLNTLLYRLYVATERKERMSRLDTLYSGVLQDLDSRSGMAVDSRGCVYVLDRKKGKAHVLDPAGRISNTFPTPQAHSIFINDHDEVYLTSETEVIAPGNRTLALSVRKENKELPLEEIRSLAVNQLGEYFVVSGDFPGILKYHPNAGIVSAPPPGKEEKEYQKVLVNSWNQLYAMDKQRRRVTLFSQEGKPVFEIGPSGEGYEFDRIEDFAVDVANHIYLLTRDPKGILVFGPSGTLMEFLPAKKDDSVLFEKARFIAVSPAGFIYILDEDVTRILKMG